MKLIEVFNARNSFLASDIRLQTRFRFVLSVRFWPKVAAHQELARLSGIAEEWPLRK